MATTSKRKTAREEARHWVENFKKTAGKRVKVVPTPESYNKRCREKFRNSLTFWSDSHENDKAWPSYSINGQGRYKVF